MAAHSASYTSKIIKASALLPDTKLLLAAWNLAEPPAANLDRMRRENIFGKTSRSRVEDILPIFRQRYATDPQVLTALVTLAQGPLPGLSLDRILYFLSLQADALLHDLVLDLLAPRFQQGQSEITVRELENWIRDAIAEGKTTRSWSAITITRVAQNALAALRDFGILQGILHKRLAVVHLPVPAFAFLAFLLYRRQSSGDAVLHSPEWRSFFLDGAAVERLFLEAHQERLLSYYAAGRVVRLEFPAATPEEYARVLTQRAG